MEDRVIDRIARKIVSFEFPTKEALELYLKQHPDADKSKHWVKKSKTPKVEVKKEKHKQKLLNNLKQVLNQSTVSYDETPDTPEEEEMWYQYRTNKDRFFSGDFKGTDYNLLFAKGDPLAFVTKYIGDPLAGWNPLGAKIKNPRQAATMFMTMRNPLFESCKVLYLDKNKKVVGNNIHSVGQVDGTNIDKDKIINEATSLNAKFVLLSHNHPSGNAIPSSQDIGITRAIESLLKPHDISVFDHIVTNGEGFSIKTGQKFQLDTPPPAWGDPSKLKYSIRQPDEAKAILEKITQKDCVYGIMLNTKGFLIGMIKISGDPQSQKEQIKDLQNKMAVSGSKQMLFAAPPKSSEISLGVLDLIKELNENKIETLDVFDLAELKSLRTTGFFSPYGFESPNIPKEVYEKGHEYSPSNEIRTFKGKEFLDFFGISTKAASSIIRFKDALQKKLSKLSDEEINDFLEENVVIIRKSFLATIKKTDYPTDSEYFRDLKSLSEMRMKDFLFLFNKLSR